jgi:hypothetical protein
MRMLERAWVCVYLRVEKSRKSKIQRDGSDIRSR